MGKMFWFFLLSWNLSLMAQLTDPPGEGQQEWDITRQSPLLRPLGEEQLRFENNQWFETLNPEQRDDFFARYYEGEQTVDSLSTIAGWSGGGADLALTQDNIWFIQPGPVRVCVERSRQYPLSQTELEGLVQQSLMQWRSFFQDQGLINRPLVLPQEPQVPVFGRGRSRQLNFDFQFTSCEQLRRFPLVQSLVFYFGVSNGVIEVYKSLETEHAFGLALRQKYDHRSHANGGFVWISNRLKTREQIHHLLLHEIGHVFGMKHDSVFVMNEDVVKDIRKLHPRFLAQIESPAWPFRLQPGKTQTLTANQGDENPLACGRDRFHTRSIPNKLREQLRFAPNSCFSIDLRLVSHAPGQNMILKLVIANDTGTRHELTGQFRSFLNIGKFSKAPHVYTWLPLAPNKSRFGLVTLGAESEGLPARGFFTVDGRSQMANFPAVIDDAKGLSLEIYSPMEDQWWVITGIHGNRREI